MLIWIITIILLGMAILGWLFLKRDPDKYIHEKASPINIFFKFGRFYHRVFKVIVVVLVMMIIFLFYKYLLSSSREFALTAAVISGIILTGGKELLDKYITKDDVFVSILGISIGFSILFLLF
jgi:hypothetical protein